MHHAGIWVRPSELDAVIAFFLGVLGYAEVSRAERKSSGERVFLKNSSSQYIEVLVSDDVEVLDAYPHHPKNRVEGVAHLCFSVPNIDEARATAEKLGAQVTLQAPADGRYGTSELGEHRILFLQAPGNISIELFEFRNQLDL